MQKQRFIRTMTIAALLLGPHTVRSDPLAAGEVVKVDGPTGTITVRHGPIVQLGLTAPSKVDAFRVNGDVMQGMVFNALRPGDQIEFRAQRVNGELTITDAAKK